MAEKSDKNWTPARVFTVCEKMQLIENIRALNRALINAMFNGGNPYSKEEQEKYQIQINVNWLEGQRLMSTATNQLNNALVFKERFFTAKSKKGPVEKRDDFSETFTANIHEPLKNGVTGKRQMFLLKSRNASVALHGIGPIMWSKDFAWAGRYIALEDLLIPTDTLCDFSNLMFFGVNQYLTAGEFFDMTYGSGKVNEGWNKEAVNKILDYIIKPEHQQGTQFTFQNQPEKRVEWVKQNRCFIDIDSAATVKLRMFFYRDSKTMKWMRCAMLREGVGEVGADKEFIFDGGGKPFAGSVDHILHIQYGDNSIVAPLKYHSVRGLGVLLYAPVEANNRLRCELLQAAFMDLKTILKTDNPTDRDRPKVLDLSQYSVMEDGWKMLTRQERWQPDSQFIQAVQGQMRQLMSEGSAGYVQNIGESQSSQPRTAYETSVLSNQANVQVSAMLQLMYAQEEYYWQEVVRRFLNPTSEDEEVKEFQKKCLADGIPKELMVPENWLVRVERSLGAGDHSRAVEEANMLLSQKQWMDPNSQRIVDRKWVSTITRDPAMGRLLVPDNPSKITPGIVAAEDVFGTLMQGVPAGIREGIDRGQYVESLLGMLNSKIQQITQIDNMGTPQELIGLQTVIQHIGQNIQILSQDPAKKQNVKIYGDELGKLENLVKAFGSRQQQAAQEKQNQIDPETTAKIQGQQQLTQAKLQTSQATTQQKLQQRNDEFMQKMTQRQQEFEAEMAQMIQRHQLEVATTTATATTDVANANAKTKAEIENSKKKAESASVVTAEK